MLIPGRAAVPVQEVQVHEAAVSAAEAMAMEVRRVAASGAAAPAGATTVAPVAAEPVSPVNFALGSTPTPSADRSGSRGNSRSGTRSSTTIERIIAKTSPYGSLRTLASVVFGVGMLVAVLLFFGGLAGMLVLSVQNQTMLGIGIFAGAMIVALLLGIGAKAAHDVIRLMADVGDRSRQMSIMMEDLLNRPRDESF
jgi:hypothetical protein